jgi:hypothetical protein
MDEDALVAKLVNALRGSGGHPDAAEDRAMMAPDLAKIGEGLQILMTCVEELYDENEKLRDQVSELTACVKDELVGGLSSLVDKRNRMSFMGSFKSEHPEFARFEQIVQDLSGEDLWEKVGNEAYDYKKRPDYTDEGFGSLMQEMIGALEGRFGKYAGSMPMQAASGKKPEVEIEVSKVSGDADVDPALAAFLKKTAKNNG